MNVSLICGGKSGEHCVSVQSAKNIYKALSDASIATNLIYISKETSWFFIPGKSVSTFFSQATYNSVALPSDAEEIFITPGASTPLKTVQNELNTDVFFPIVHGPGGEDGSLQGLFELLDIPYVGPDLLSSAVCMDKVTCKVVLERAGIKTAPFTVAYAGETPQINLKYPVFVKPSAMGSSVGVSKVLDESELEAALECAFEFDDVVLIEEGITGKELECAVLGNKNPKSSAPGLIIPPDSFYSFDAKYIDNSTDIMLPAPVSEQEADLLKETAIKSYLACRCAGLSRVDMFLTDSGEVIVNEINTLPGFTEISMYPKLWEHEGLSYAELVKKLIQLATKA